MNRDAVNLTRLEDLAAALEGTPEGDVVAAAVHRIVELEKQPRWVSLKFEPELEPDEFVWRSGSGDVLGAYQKPRKIRGEYIDEEGRLWTLLVPCSYVDSVAAVTYRRVGE